MRSHIQILNWQDAGKENLKKKFQLKFGVKMIPRKGQKDLFRVKRSSLTAPQWRV